MDLEIDAFHRSEFPIYVTSFNKNGFISDFSSNSTNSNLSVISAPGEDVFSFMPENKYDFNSGTSMAAPIVSATIALAKSNFPELSNDQIRSALARYSLYSRWIQVFMDS